MKTKLHLLSASTAFLALAGVAAFGDNENKNTSTNIYHKDRENARAANQRNAREHLGYLSRSSDVIGMNVENLQDEKLGKVHDLAVDLESGRIVQVIVSVGGFLGVGDRLVAIPPSSLTYDTEHKVHLDTTKARLKEAPVFDTTHWESNWQPDRVVAVYRYYNITPYFADDTLKTTPNESRLGYTARASKVVGLKVKNLLNQTVGKVDNLFLDLPGARIVEVVVSAGGFLGVGEELNAIPPKSFHFTPEHDALILDASKDFLSKAPRFKNSDWRAMDNYKDVAGVYNYYHVDPYFDVNSVDADNTGRNIRDRRNNTLTPFDQGTSESDLSLTRDIRKALRDHDGLSVSAQNVKIITRDGRVTLRGPVSSEEEKKVLNEIATRYASAGNIQDQLEVKRGDLK